MEDVTKGKVGATPPQEQSRLNKPFSPLAPTKLPLSTGSSFQVWKNPYCISHGDATDSSNLPRRSHIIKFPGSPPSPITVDRSRMERNPIFDPANQITSPTNGIGAISGAGDDAYAARIDNTQAAQFKLGPNFEPNMDPKMMRKILSNRLSARRSKLRKMQHVANLESLAKELEEKISILHPQFEDLEIHKQFLKLEQEAVNKKITAFEENKRLQEAEIEKNKAEVNMLRELYRIQEEQFQAQASMFDWHIGLPLTSSNFYSNAAQNEGETSNKEVNIAQEDQDQICMTSWERTLQNSITNSEHSMMSESDELKTNLSSTTLLRTNPTVMNKAEANPTPHNRFI